MLKLARDEGIQLNDDQLEAVSGGSCLPRSSTPTNAPNVEATTSRRTATLGIARNAATPGKKIATTPTSPRRVSD